MVSVGEQCHLEKKDILFAYVSTIFFTGASGLHGPVVVIDVINSFKGAHKVYIEGNEIFIYSRSKFITFCFVDIESKIKSVKK